MSTSLSHRAYSRALAASGLLALVSTACAPADPGADAGQTAAAPTSEAETVTPRPAPADPAPAPPAAETTSAVAPDAPADAADAAVSEAERYTGGRETLETAFDLSKLKEQPAAAPEGHDHGADDGHDHGPGDGHDHGPGDGHDHGETGDVAVAPARSSPTGTTPTGLETARPTRYRGNIGLGEGESKSHDFGLIRAGESRQKIFQLVSDGEDPVVIKAIKPSCGCTKAEISLVADDGALAPYERGDEIPVGQKFQLLTEISTEGKHGAFGTSVSIYSDSLAGTTNFKLQAEVEPVFDVLPQATLFFGQLSTADAVDETLTIKTRRGELFKLEPKPETMPEEVSIELTPKDPDAEGRAAEWTARVTAGPGLPLGVRNYPCALQSDLEVVSPKYPNPDGSPKLHVIPISVQARVTGMVHATPGFVGFGLVRPGEVVERNVELECFDDFKLTADLPIEIGGLYGGEFEYADHFTTTLEPLEDGKKLDLLLRLEGLPETATGSFGGVMNIQVGHPAMESLTVRFSGVCRAELAGRSNN